MKIKLFIVILSLSINFSYGYNIKDIFNIKRENFRDNRSVGRIELSEKDKIKGILNSFIQGLQDNDLLTMKELLADAPSINDEKTDKIYFMNKIRDRIGIILGMDKSELKEAKLINIGDINVNKRNDNYDSNCLFAYGGEKFLIKFTIEKIDNYYKITGISISKNKYSHIYRGER